MGTKVYKEAREPKLRVGSQENRTVERCLKRNTREGKKVWKGQSVSTERWEILCDTLYGQQNRKTGNGIMILYTQPLFILCLLKESDAFVEASGDPQSLWKDQECAYGKQSDSNMEVFKDQKEQANRLRWSCNN